MATRHLVTDRDLSLLCNVNSYYLVYSGRKLVGVVTREGADVNNNTAFAVRQTERCVAYFACFFAKDGAQKSFFGGKLCFTLGCNLTYEDVTCVYLSTYTDNTSLIGRASCRERV